MCKKVIEKLNPANICLFKVNIFIATFEHIYHLFPVFLFLTIRQKGKLQEFLQNNL